MESQLRLTISEKEVNPRSSLTPADRTLLLAEQKCNDNNGTYGLSSCKQGDCYCIPNLQLYVRISKCSSHFVHELDDGRLQ